MMGIGARLRLNAILPLGIALLLILLVGYAGWHMRAVHGRSAQSRELSTAVFELGLLTDSYLVEANARKRVQWYNAFAAIRSRLDHLTMDIPSGSLEHAQVLSVHLDELFDALVLAQRNLPATAEAERFLGSQLRVATLELVSTIRLMAHRYETGLQNTLIRTSLLVVVITTLAALASAVMLHRVNSVITLGIARLENGMREAGKGDLAYRIEPGGPPEISTLARSFNTMGSRLLEITVARDRLVEENKVRVRAETALREAEQQLRRALMLAPVPIMVHAEGGEVLLVNRTWLEITGYTLEEIPTMAAWVEKGLVDMNSTQEEQLRSLYTLEERVCHGEFQIRTRVGEKRIWLYSSSPLGHMPDGRRLVISVAQDITERKHSEIAVAWRACHDTLTGLPNRALFMDLLVQELAHARRDRYRVAVLFLDLDRFKHVNDALGHDIGDGLLSEVARRLRTNVRESDTVARLGGDEFNVLMPAIRNSDDVARVAEKILLAFDAPFLVQGHAIHTSTSIGVGIFPDDARKPVALLRAADLAMYYAKEHGRNRFHFFDHALNARVDQRLDLERELGRAVERDELEVHYQPQMDLATGAIVTVEALMRWRHPQRGLLGPEQFLSVAEESGLILPLGEQLLRAACHALKNRAGEAPPLRLSVNLSPREFLHPDMVERVLGILTETGLDPRGLELEIDEDTLMQELDVMLPRLRRLADAGVRVAVDHYGRGCSSLNWLHRLPVSLVKLDRSFVQELGTGPDDMQLVDAVVSMAHTLHKQVCAGGVETDRQRTLLASHGCDHIQGRLVGTPVPTLAW